MDDLGPIAIVSTFETWKRHPTLESVYIGQLSYLYFYDAVELPDDPLEAFLEASRRDDVQGFSLETGIIKIIGSARQVIFANAER